jgi:hypothetical protein
LDNILWRMPRDAAPPYLTLECFLVLCTHLARRSKVRLPRIHSKRIGPIRHPSSVNVLLIKRTVLMSDEWRKGRE